ncbi:hypothetical protein [Aeromonas hydrophila]|uniref:hypothetical protein n=1 Tax=Aeromonas hydrophila TaxID=644 RepID=UPI003D1D89BC
MTLNQTDMLLLIETYGQDKWIETAQGKLDAPALGHYNFTTEDFSQWYNHATEFTEQPIAQPSFATINATLGACPKCSKIGSDSDPHTSWRWQLYP